MTFSARLAAIGAAVLSLGLPSQARSSEGVGLASWYQLPGRTACGQPHNPEAMTAAHRSLPCGATVKVTNLANGRSAVVTIVDRGPFTRGRIIDVSRGAARELGLIQRGVGRVRIARR